jgi:hypothetical protein
MRHYAPASPTSDNTNVSDIGKSRQVGRFWRVFVAESAAIWRIR